MKSYQLIDSGFCIRIDMRLYSREAVMKSFYRLHDKYIISYEVDQEFLLAYFEANPLPASIDDAVAGIMKELDFQMIRLDTIRHSQHIRELLVARSLYATCIEPERESPSQSDVEEQESWLEDQNRVFASWSAE